MKFFPFAAAILSLGGAAFADGNADAGLKEFGKCKSCHMIVNGDEVIQKGGKTGPNLYGVIGRKLGGDPGFDYGDGFEEAAEQGLVWTEEMLAKYVADPSGFMQEVTGDKKARSKMTFKLKKGGEDVAAYLASVGPAVN